MKNLLLILTLLSWCEVTHAQIKVDRVEQYRKEALAITPARTWVKDLDSLNWYYGYKEGGIFYYVKTRQQNALSDFSSLYPISYRRGEMLVLPRVKFVYESYQAQFERATKEPVVVKDKRPIHKHSEPFGWITRPSKHKGGWDWTK